MVRDRARHTNILIDMASTWHVDSHFLFIISIRFIRFKIK